MDIRHSPLGPAGCRESILEVLSDLPLLGIPPLLSSLKLGLLHGTPPSGMAWHVYAARWEDREVGYRRVPSEACLLEV